MGTRRSCIRQLMAKHRQKIFRRVEISLETASPSPAATWMLLQVSAVPAWVADAQQPIWVALFLSQASVPGEGRRAVPGHGHCWHPAPLERAGALGVMPSVLVALSQDVGRFGRICPTQWGLSWALTPARSRQSRRSLCLQPLAHFGAEWAPSRDRGAPAGPLPVSPLPLLYLFTACTPPPRPFPQSVFL